jgi:hypothetical protein
MMNRKELKNKLDEMLDKSPNLSPKEWENAYIDMYEECDTRALLEDCLEEAIITKYGEKAYEDLLNDTGDQVKEIKDMEDNPTDVKLTEEQEQLLNDLF